MQQVVKVPGLSLCIWSINTVAFLSFPSTSTTRPKHPRTPGPAGGLFRAHDFSRKFSYFCFRRCTWFCLRCLLGVRQLIPGNMGKRQHQKDKMWVGSCVGVGLAPGTGSSPVNGAAEGPQSHERTETLRNGQKHREMHSSYFSNYLTPAQIHRYSQLSHFFQPS